MIFLLLVQAKLTRQHHTYSTLSTALVCSVPALFAREELGQRREVRARKLLLELLVPRRVDEHFSIALQIAKAVDDRLIFSSNSSSGRSVFCVRLLVVLGVATRGCHDDDLCGGVFDLFRAHCCSCCHCCRVDDCDGRLGHFLLLRGGAAAEERADVARACHSCRSLRLAVSAVPLLVNESEQRFWRQRAVLMLAASIFAVF